MVRSGASPCRAELSFQLFVFLTFDHFHAIGSCCWDRSISFLVVLTIPTDTQGGWEGMGLDDLFCHILV